MNDLGKTNAFAVVESLTGWWELAGLDSAVRETAVNLLADDSANNSADTAIVPTVARKQAGPPLAPSIAWPEDIATLSEMVKSGASLPGNVFGPERFGPVGPADADVMIISDLPDIIDASQAPVAMASNAALLKRMMAAIGIDTSNCYRSGLATSMPPTGEVPEDALPELAAFMLHQIKLIRPTSVVILGSSACKALLNDELMNARAELRKINHDGLNITTLTTFHPRTLIARPAMKKQAWKDLQMFAKRAIA